MCVGEVHKHDRDQIRCCQAVGGWNLWKQFISNKEHSSDRAGKAEPLIFAWFYLTAKGNIRIALDFERK